VLVVSRRHLLSYFDASLDEKADIWQAVDEAKSRLDEEHAPEEYTVGFNTHTKAGEASAHLHIHVIPRPAEVRSRAAGSSDTTGEDASRLAALLSPTVTTLTSGFDNPFAPQLFRDLEGAVQVDIAVAFVFSAALQAGVLPRLRDLLAREGSRVRLLTGDYHGVTEPAALRTLLMLKELATGPAPPGGAAESRGTVELRMFETERAGCSFHPKAYLLYGDTHGRGLATYVGSSNLSRTALFDGVEWNLRLASQDAAGLAREQFELLFSHEATCELTHDWVDAYEKRRPVVEPGKPLPEVALREDAPLAVPEPTFVQVEALEALEASREAGNRAGLVVLATGLGKTWLSAFDSTRERGFQRVLFVAHRAEILTQAMTTYSRIRPDASVGLYTGHEKSFDATLLFASVQTLSQQKHLTRFAADHFDYIVVDEFHHAAAETYRRVLDHFEPKFLLGLTATPERTDGGDLLALCDENLVYECGLAVGVRSGLLSPFHYFGVPDIVEYAQIPWRSGRFDDRALTEAVATSVRAQNALEQLEVHGAERILAFCVSQRHADFMCGYFREHSAFRCASVHSGPTSDSRSAALEQLACGELDILFCVDMFNEGLDVPSIDTVLMLRPTESKVIWLQQLGRGLRRHKNKTHLRVIDYIGNHRSFLEKPAALLAALGVTVTSLRELTRLLADKSYDLPPGCGVTYSLEAQSILDKLCPPSRKAKDIREWYEEFRKHAERRPSAREALHSGYDPRAVHGDFGSWLAFVREMKDLSAAEQAALELDRAFLFDVETRAMRRSHDLVLLDAMRALGELPGTVAFGDLVAAFRRRASRSAALRADVAVDLDDKRALTEALEAGPIRAWCRTRGADGSEFFSVAGKKFRTSQGIVGDSPEFSALVSELIEWRVSEYLSRRPQEPVLDVARNARGQPILKLDRQRYELPEDWVVVMADSAPLRARYLKQSVDVARPPDRDRNELGKLLKRWFGEEAGTAGAKHRVVQRTDPQGNLTWRPMIPQSVIDDSGSTIDARFDVEAFEGEPTIVFHSRGAGRNDEYGRGLEVLLRRLGQQGVRVRQIAIESGGTRALPLDKRILQLPNVSYPIDLAAVQDVAQLRTSIGKVGAAVGRKPGAKGGGNSNKRLRIWLSRSVEMEELSPAR
jgi:superfamily II DNA or RNA helicase